LRTRVEIRLPIHWEREYRAAHTIHRLRVGCNHTIHRLRSAALSSSDGCCARPRRPLHGSVVLPSPSWWVQGLGRECWSSPISFRSSPRQHTYKPITRCVIIDSLFPCQQFQISGICPLQPLNDNLNLSTRRVPCLNGNGCPNLATDFTSRSEKTIKKHIFKVLHHGFMVSRSKIKRLQMHIRTELAFRSNESRFVDSEIDFLECLQETCNDKLGQKRHQRIMHTSTICL
jgi:hypothetical protein